MEEELLSMIGAIHKRQFELEEECAVLSELLKPWPPHKNEALQVQPDIDSTNPEESDVKDEKLSREEQEALLTVEKLLHKAQIARQVKTKPKAQAEHRHFESTQESKNKTCTEQMPREATSNEGQQLRTDKVRKNPPTRDEKLSHTNHFSRNSRPACASKVQASTSVDKNVSTAFKAQSHKSVRPSRPTSGKNGYLPAHMSAPFKTDSLIVPTRRKTQSRLSSCKPRAGSGISRASSYQTLPAIKQVGDGQQCRVDTSRLEDRPGLSEERLLVTAQEYGNPSSEVWSERCGQPDPGEMERQTPRGSTSCLSDRYSGESLPGDVGEDITVGHQTMETQHGQESKRFTLRRNGSSLKLPGKLAKLVRHNDSLRQQCSATQLLKRVSPTDSGQQFVDRLQREWTVSEELWTRVRAVTCLRAHGILSHMFEELELDKLTAQSPYRDLYRAKRTMEFILSMFASLQEETDYLADVQFRALDQPSPPDVSSCVNTGAASLVFSDHAREQTIKDVGVHQYLNGCEEWTRLKFTEKYLQGQIRLLELVRAEWWRELSVDVRDLCVLQNVYSLVSSGGQFLPTFVANNQL